ncbi:uncharacterized protein LOC6641869 isoform X2 [Drosophila willistoni]|uniref:uncharacterized protein LOC6641869 isoform X2 n=1 Tax=Drosophila willistoni TaxID=7260 RepID=UPI001F074F6F|nr:uncharacterized protein LOC6641869 isoform X2 [Drosophila willistoni]
MLMHTTSTSSTSTATMTNSSSSATPTPGSTSSNNSATLETLHHQQQQQQQQLHQQLQQLHTNTTNNSNSRPPSRAPSILDSPTLARVERARLRLEQQERERDRSSLGGVIGGGSGGMGGVGGIGVGGGGSSTGTGSTATTMNREDSLERSILDPKKETSSAPWHQMWTHMKRLSHASKVNSTSSLTAQKTDLGVGHHHHPGTAGQAGTITATPNGTSTMPGKCILFPDKTSSLKSSMYTQQVYFRPDMQSLLAGRIPVASMTGPIKRGLLWQQRDRLFSRWKERYFVLTRDYLHCFKRASGSANERASDMGQFIFKVKLVDVEKVEWLNRRSYSAIGLLLGREGRVLLRCDDGLEDWFELLEECTLTSKERRRALKIAQGPRSRASLAAPVSHASLQFQHFGLGGTYSTALDDWLMTNGTGGGLARHKIGAGSLNGYGGANPFFSDSVPDLSALNNENHNHHLSGISTNHSTPQKIPHHSNANLSRYSNGYVSAQNSFTAQSAGQSGLYGSPRRIFINSSFGSNQVVDEETEETEVQLRRPRLFRGVSATPDNGNELDRDWLYRKPRPPTDMRHSVQPMLPIHNNGSSAALAPSNKTSELDCSAHDSGLDTPPSTHRPSSYREASRDSTETNGSSSRGTLLNNSSSPGGSFRGKKLSPQVTNLNQLNALHGSRYSVQDQRILKMRNNDHQEDRCASIKLANLLNHNNEPQPSYDPNQNRYYKHGNATPPISLTPQHTPQHKMYHANGNGNGTLNGNGGQSTMNGSAIFRERYQHPALAAIINEAQGLKFRGRSQELGNFCD